MTDDSELNGLDPFDIWDGEAGRIDAYLAGLDDGAWDMPTRCEGWSIRDLLAHLLASEAYHHAGLRGEVAALMEHMAQRGATDIASFNAMGIADLADRSPQDLLDAWREADGESRRGFRERDDGEVDTSVGRYPCRWQAFHVAGELAVHADDMGVPVAAAEAAARRAWRSRFSRFALAETKPEVSVAAVAGRTRVQHNDVMVEVDDADLIEAVAGRLSPSVALADDARALLSTMP